MSTSKNRSFGPALSMDEKHSLGAADPRPSKLRDAMARMSGDNQALNALERAEASVKLANINKRNRERYGQ